MEYSVISPRSAAILPTSSLSNGSLVTTTSWDAQVKLVVFANQVAEAILHKSGEVEHYAVVLVTQRERLAPVPGANVAVFPRLITLA